MHTIPENNLRLLFSDTYIDKFIRTYWSSIRLHCKADIRNPLSLLAHERSRFANCQWELLTPTDISIPFTHRLVLYTLEAGDCLFCVQFTTNEPQSYVFGWRNHPLHITSQSALFPSNQETFPLRMLQRLQLPVQP